MADASQRAGSPAAPRLATTAWQPARPQRTLLRLPCTANALQRAAVEAQAVPVFQAKLREALQPLKDAVESMKLHTTPIPKPLWGIYKNASVPYPWCVLGQAVWQARHACPVQRTQRAEPCGAAPGGQLQAQACMRAAQYSCTFCVVSGCRSDCSGFVPGGASATTRAAAKAAAAAATSGADPLDTPIYPGAPPVARSWRDDPNCFSRKAAPEGGWRVACEVHARCTWCTVLPGSSSELAWRLAEHAAPPCLQSRACLPAWAMPTWIPTRP